jgi:hypothetical protein
MLPFRFSTASRFPAQTVFDGMEAERLKIVLPLVDVLYARS